MSLSTVGLPGLLLLELEASGWQTAANAGFMWDAAPCELVYEPTSRVTGWSEVSLHTEGSATEGIHHNNFACMYIKTCTWDRWEMCAHVSWAFLSQIIICDRLLYKLPRIMETHPCGSELELTLMGTKEFQVYLKFRAWQMMQKDHGWWSWQ